MTKEVEPIPLPKDWVVWFCERCGREWAASSGWAEADRRDEGQFVCPDDNGTVIKGRS